MRHDSNTDWSTIGRWLILIFALLAPWSYPSKLFALQESQSFAPADTSSPRDTLKSFIDSCNGLYDRLKEDRYLDKSNKEDSALAQRIMDCLDTSQTAEFQRSEFAAEAAICLKEVLDRLERLDFQEIPGDDEVLNAEESGELDNWRLPGTRITISRLTEGPRRHEYLFSAGTVGRSRDYYDSVQDLPYRTTGPRTSPGFLKWYETAPTNRRIGEIVDRLPDWFRETTFGEVRWKLCGVFVTGTLAILVMFVLERTANRLSRYYREKSAFAYGLTIIPTIMAACVPMIFDWIARTYWSVRGGFQYVLSFTSDLIVLLFVIVLVHSIANRISSILIASPGINPRGLDAQFIRIVARLTAIVLSVIVFLEGGRYLGFPLTTLLASAGVGGVAIALAAQDTLKNLFGTIMLLIDKPFRVGERIIFRDFDGVVEDIGLRSTRIRLLNGNQATVPNDELARTDIENVGRRPHIRQEGLLEIPSVANVEKIRRAAEIVRENLDSHEGMEEDFPPRVHIRELSESSIGITFMYWYHPPSFWDCLEFRERLIVNILAQLEAEQIPYSRPTLGVHLNQATPP